MAAAKADIIPQIRAFIEIERVPISPFVTNRKVPIKANKVHIISLKKGNRFSVRQFHPTMIRGKRYCSTVAAAALLYLIATK